MRTMPSFPTKPLFNHVFHHYENSLNINDKNSNWEEFWEKYYKKDSFELQQDVLRRISSLRKDIRKSDCLYCHIIMLRLELWWLRHFDT